MPATLRAFRLLLCLPLLFGLVAVSGCGSKGTLSGTVNYKGKPLKGGNVTLVAADGGRSMASAIGTDGTYKIENVRSGTYKICVETSSLRPTSGSESGVPMGPPGLKTGGPSGKIKNEPPPGVTIPEGYKTGGGTPATIRKENLARYVEIPEKYADQAQTPLTVDVKGGVQDHPINLD